MLFKPFDVGFNVRSAASQSFKKAGVVGRSTADSVRLNARRLRVCLDLADDVVKLFHAADYAKRHTTLQVPIDALNEKPDWRLKRAMQTLFRTALLWHMEREGTKIVDLVNATGISRDVINKLLAREGSSTVVENAILVSAYYGKTLDQFLRMEDPDASRPLAALTALLLPDEAQLLEAQIRGILARRGAR